MSGRSIFATVVFMASVITSYSIHYTKLYDSIQARGITPDILVRPGEIREDTERKHFREKDLKNHFETPEKVV